MLIEGPANFFKKYYVITTVFKDQFPIVPLIVNVVCVSRNKIHKMN